MAYRDDARDVRAGSCSMFGAWGNATASRGGQLLQLRALDWDTDGPFKNYPVLVRACVRAWF